MKLVYFAWVRERVGKADQVLLAGAAPVVQHQQPLRLAVRRSFEVNEPHR